MRHSSEGTTGRGSRWRLLAMTASLLLCFSADAASRWYHVEVIVFRYTEPRYADGEQWVVPTILPDFRSATRLTRPVSGSMGGAAGPDAPDQALARRLTAFRPLEPGSLAMRNIAGALRRTADIEVMLHTGWLQPSFGNAGARYVYLDDLPLPDPEAAAEQRLNGGAGAEPELDRRRPPAIDPMFDDEVIDVETVLAPEREFYGVLRLRTGRQLAVDTDFVLNYEAAPVRLRESRRVLFRDTHYFDHPLFGLIVRILPYRLPGNEVDDAPVDDEPVDEAESAGGSASAASEAVQGGVQ